MEINRKNRVRRQVSNIIEIPNVDLEEESCHWCDMGQCIAHSIGVKNSIATKQKVAMLLQKLFPLVLEIKSKTGILHFKRWRIFSCSKFNIFLHEISEADKDLHLHNHPWNFRSIILWGCYVELLKLGKYDGTNADETQSSLSGRRDLAVNLHKPFSIYKKHKNEFHKILSIVKDFKFLGMNFHSEKVYSLVLTGPHRFDEWGYSVNNVFMDHIEYRQRKNQNAL